MYIHDRNRTLAALLRGESVPKFEPEPARGGLPRALALWQSQQAEREAEELRRATTPRAWVDGEELTPTVPSIEQVERKLEQMAEPEGE